MHSSMVRTAAAILRSRASFSSGDALRRETVDFAGRCVSADARMWRSKDTWPAKAVRIRDKFMGGVFGRSIDTRVAETVAVAGSRTPGDVFCLKTLELVVELVDLVWTVEGRHDCREKKLGD